MNGRRVVTSTHGRVLACESCAGEEMELGFISGDKDLSYNKPTLFEFSTGDLWLV